jgi:hypothetical protein
MTRFITFQGKEYVRLKWANKKWEEWVERSEYIQERPSSERKRQKPEVLTSTKIGELSDNPSERKVNVDIVLSDKQEAYLKDIYQRMPTEASELQEVITKRHSMWCSGKSVLLCGVLDERSRQYLSSGDKQHLPLSRRYRWASRRLLGNNRIWRQFEGGWGNMSIILRDLKQA